MRVLVTGGTGYLGAAIVRAARSRGHDAVAFARRVRESEHGASMTGDVRDPVALRSAFRGIDAVVHSAALVSVWRQRPQEFDEVNIEGLRNVLSAAGDAGVRHLVYTSSFLARPPRGHPRALEANDYQRTKVRALEVARSAATGRIPLTILVPGVVYGPGVVTEGNLVGRLIRDHLDRRLPGLIGADHPWSYAFVDDVANAHVTAIERGIAGEYTLGGENASQLRVFEIVRHLTGRPLPRRIPLAVARAAAIVEELRARWFARPPVLTRGVVDIFSCDWSLDSARSVQELSYRITPLEEGLERTLRSLL